MYLIFNLKCNILILTKTPTYMYNLKDFKILGNILFHYDIYLYIYNTYYIPCAFSVIHLINCITFFL